MEVPPIAGWHVEGLTWPLPSGWSLISLFLQGECFDEIFFQFEAEVRQT